MSGRTVRLVLVALGVGLVAAGLAAWQRWMDVSVLPLPPEEIPTAQSRQCPDEGEIINVEWMGRPETWREAVAGADLIVVAKRLADRPQVKNQGECDFVSYYAFTILQTVKGHAGVDDRLTVGFRGRPLDRVDELPHPEAGEPLVLFLKAQNGVYYLRYGPGGIARVVEALLAPYSESDYGLSEVMGLPLDRFLTGLREVAPGR